MSSDFKAELIDSEDDFKRNDDYDGALLWFCLMKNVHPTTKVSFSNHKDKLHKAKIKDFGCDVKKSTYGLKGRDET